MTLQWKDPPHTGNAPRVDYDAIIDELKANAGQWALVFEARSAGMAFKLKCLGCETRTSQIKGTHNHDIYARWPVDP